jgi:hypothetical protein
MSALEGNLSTIQGCFQLIARAVRKGAAITAKDEEQIRLIRGWCDELLAHRADPAEVYHRAREDAI